MTAPVVPLMVPKKDTLSAQVTRYLLDVIACEQLQPGDMAPSEAKVSRDLGISRGIVREAYRALATLGILEIESGKQPRVRGLSSSVLTQIIGFALRTAHVSAPQVLELRRVVEIEGARLAAERGTEAHFKRLRECVAKMSEAGTDHQRLIAADADLHTTLAEAAANPLFALMLGGLRGPLEDSMAQGLQSRRTREEVLQVPQVHKTIVQRVCARDGAGAAKAMAHHFDISVAAILAASMASAASEPREQNLKRRR
jgi:GntR family transcriptional repressor for pyruvate dehydrogenase complex